MDFRKTAIALLAVLMLMSISGCQPQGQTEATVTPTQLQTEATAVPTELVTAQATQAPSQTQTEAPTEEATELERAEAAERNLHMSVNGLAVNVIWEDNDSVTALRELCADGTLTVPMSMYGGFEQVGSLGMTLPSSDADTTTSAGDIVLYSSSNLVVFYGSNTWAYTRLGHITNLTDSELTELLSNGDVTITLTME